MKNSESMIRMKQLRTRSGLSQSKFANYFGMSVKTVQSWEIGISKPPKYVADMIERILDLEGYPKGD